MKQRTLNEIRQSKEYQQAVKSIVIPEVSDIDVVKNKIVESLHHQMFDIVFQAVCDEMSKFKVFQEDNYLTESGMDMFQEQWFEFYHEHHGDILHQVIKNITN
jgi:hypothetical protein